MDHILDLSSHEVLACAIAVEKRNAEKIEESGFRFLPYNPEISKVLEEINTEKTKNKKALEALYENHFGEYALQISPSDILLVHNTREGLFQDHFFVINQEMAQHVLESVLHQESYSSCFYEFSTRHAVRKEIRELYKKLCCKSQDYKHKILQCLTEYATDIDFFFEMVIEKRGDKWVNTDADLNV